MSRKLPTEIATALIGELAATSQATLALRFGPEQVQSAGVCKSLSDYATLLNAFVDRLGEVMTESNILPYDGQAISMSLLFGSPSSALAIRSRSRVRFR